MPIQQAQQLGRYYLLDRVAFGGMAEIFSRQDPRRPRQRAFSSLSNESWPTCAKTMSLSRCSSTRHG